MAASSNFDAASAHRYFAAECFNRAWTFIDKQERSADEDEQMLLLAQASLWHWTQRADCTPRSLSIGYWQLSRIYALLQRAEDATRAGQRCLAYAKDEPPFFVAYGHEALARAALLSADRCLQTEHLTQARRLATLVEDAEERTALEADLKTIASA